QAQAQPGRSGGPGAPCAGPQRATRMSEPEDFISRWSRRKRDAAKDAQVAEKADPANAAPPDASPIPSSTPAAAEPAAVEASAPVPGPNGGTCKEPAFDIPQLPSIESIAAETDIRAFLGPGVPPDLARAALRRAWAADPGIRDFVGLAENAWDFTAPGAIEG